MENDQSQSSATGHALKALTHKLDDLSTAMRPRQNVPDAYKSMMDNVDDLNNLLPELREAHRQTGYAVMFALAKLDTLAKYPHADSAFHFIAPRAMTSPEGLARHLSIPYDDFEVEIAHNGKKHGLVFLYPYWCQEFSGFLPVLYEYYQ